MPPVIVFFCLLMLSTAFVNAQLLGTFVLAFSSSLTVNAGSTATLTVTVTSISNFVRPVYLSVSGAPPGVYVSFDYNPVTPPPDGSDFSTATFSVDASVPGGTYRMKLLGTSGEQVKNFGLALDITGAAPGDFGISVSPSSVSVSAGNTASATVTIYSINQYSSSVSLTASGQPSGVNVNFSPNPVTPSGGSTSSTITLSVQNFVQAGNYYITITGHGGGMVMIQHSTQLTLQVISSGDFSINVSPSSVSISAGSSTTATVAVTSINGFTSSVTLSSSGQPSGVAVNFSPNTITPPAGSTAYSMVTISTTINVPAGSYVITITGIGNGGLVMLQHSTQLYLQISSTPTGDFTLTVNPSSITIQPGQFATAAVTVSPIAGFSGAVTLSTGSGLPPWVQVGFSPNPTYGVSTMTVAVASSSTPGTYRIRIAGASGSLSHMTAFTLTISAQAQPGFSMSASPVSVSLTPSGSATVSIVVASINGFSSPVATSTSWSGQPPTGISVTGPGTLTPTPGVPASGTLVMTGSANAPAGSYVLTVVGVSGSVTAQTTVSVQVVSKTGDFALAANPGTVSITTGATGSTVLTVLSQNGFNSPVALSASWQGTNPSGVAFTLQSRVKPKSGSTATSTLTIKATPAAVPGTYTLIVTGKSGALLHTTQVAILISQLVTTTNTTTTTSGGTSKCFIATATYGSPLAPEVQFLRTFRDREIMNTFVGRNFMFAFNAWYYSFSPTVAQSITQYKAEQTVMRTAIYPLMTILRIGATPFTLLPSHQELAAVISGLLICSLVGVTYLALPAAIFTRYVLRRRNIAKRTEGIVACTLVLSVVGIMVAELLTSSPLMILATTFTALSTILLSALMPARKILQYVH